MSRNLDLSEVGDKFGDPQKIRDAAHVWKTGLLVMKKDSSVTKLFKNSKFWNETGRISIKDLLSLLVKVDGGSLTDDQKETVFDYHLKPLWEAIFEGRKLGIISVDVENKQAHLLDEGEATDLLWIICKTIQKLPRFHLGLRIDGFELPARPQPNPQRF